MSGIRVNEWLHNSGTGGIWQSSAGNVGIASSVPTAKLVVTGDTNVSGAATVTGNLNVSGVSTATAFIPSVGQLGHRNVIINGGMLVAQRGTTSTDTEMKTVDRIQFIKSNTDQLAWTQKQLDDYPDGFSKCYEINVTTAETALAADELCYIRYKVEAQDLRPFYKASGAGKNFTLSFWVLSKQTGTYQVSIHKEDNTTRFITATYTINAAETWEYKSVTFTGDTGTSGINGDNGQGFDITWKLAVGTDYTSGGAQTTWGGFSNSIFGGGHAVDFTNSTNNYYRITGIQLELGDVATPFEHRSYADELLRCQRYLQVLTSGDDDNYFGTGYYYNSTNAYLQYRMQPEMRASPSVVQVTGTNYYYLYRDGAGDGFDGFTGFQWNSGTANAGRSGAFYNNTAMSGTAGQAGGFYASNNSAKISLDAEM